MSSYQLVVRGFSQSRGSNHYQASLEKLRLPISATMQNAVRNAQHAVAVDSCIASAALTSIYLLFLSECAQPAFRCPLLRCSALCGVCQVDFSAFEIRAEERLEQISLDPVSAARSG